MTDEQAAMVPTIKLEHLCLRKMAVIVPSAFDRRIGTLAAEAQGAMQRHALLPICQAVVDVVRQAA